MPKAPTTDRDLLEALGGVEDVARALKRKPRTIKEWLYRGVPWKDRALVEDLAAAQGVKLPADFDRKRRAA